MSKLYGAVRGVSVSSSTQLSVTMDAGTWDSGSSSAVNQNAFSMTVTIPNIITQILFENAVADALKDWWNNVFSTSFTRNDVVLIDGGIVVFPL